MKAICVDLGFRFKAPNCTPYSSAHCVYTALEPAQTLSTFFLKMLTLIESYEI